MGRDREGITTRVSDVLSHNLLREREGGRREREREGGRRRSHLAPSLLYVMQPLLGPLPGLWTEEPLLPGSRSSTYKSRGREQGDGYNDGWGGAMHRIMYSSKSTVHCMST